LGKRRWEDERRDAGEVGGELDRVQENGDRDDEDHTDKNGRQDQRARDSRPLLVQFGTERDKALLMKNLYRLKDSDSKISVRHDMTRDEREEDKSLRVEAKEKNETNQDHNVFYIVRGEPGDRRVVKVKKR